MEDRHDESHPVWVRGLKLLRNLLALYAWWSHPVWVRSFRGIAYEVRPRLLNDILSGKKHFC